MFDKLMLMLQRQQSVETEKTHSRQKENMKGKKTFSDANLTTHTMNANSKQFPLWPVPFLSIVFSLG
jgi:hypothetical protein